MSTAPDIVAFDREHLDDAATLVAARQQRLRATQPSLPERWCEPVEARRLVEAALAAEGASGFAALEDGQMVGFLVGELRLAPPWNRSGWVEMAGHATAEHRPDVARDLYAAWSDRLVREMGVYRHLVNVPAGDAEAVEVWHQLNFGQMHAFGIRSTDSSGLGPPEAGIVIRDATADDAALMEATSELIWREQVGAPSWSPILPEQIAALRGDYVEELALEDDRVWVAEDAASGEPLGVTVSYQLDPDLDVPDENMKLASTTTFTAARRRGVARALLRVVLDNAAAQGAAWCVTDWRTSSLLASRTWTALGFARTRLRLERRLDERLAWADGRE